MLPELGPSHPLPASPHFRLAHKSAASHHPGAPADPCVINAPFASSLERTPGTGGKEGRRLNWSGGGEHAGRGGHSSLPLSQHYL